jgi:N-acetylneuraminate synthase
MSVFVIAEAGVNHNGSLDLAKELIDVAAEARADAVKFQTFRTHELAGRTAPKAAYQMRSTASAESQAEMLSRLELSQADHHALLAHCRSRHIAFLSTPFDFPSLALLTGPLGLETIKVGSGEITNAPFLIAVARAARRVILSTGMSTLADIEAALGALAFGFQGEKEPPGRAAFARALATAGSTLRERTTLLHCTTEYPAPFADVNLRAMQSIGDRFGVPVGYSDHTTGIHVSLAAVALGAQVIEKHLTMDRSLPGPDHAASLEPHELRDLVRQIRDVEAALGDGIKRPVASELKNRDIARKSVVASQAIEAGAEFTEANLACKRPGGGVSPFAYWELLGRRATRRYEPDDPIDSNAAG